MMHSRLVLLTTAVACLLLLSLSCANAERKFNFPPGSAKASLGVSRLARIKNRSKQQEMTVDELANLIEQDADLVSAFVLFHLCWLDFTDCYPNLVTLPILTVPHNRPASRMFCSAFHPSQGVDLDNDILVYACAGMAVDPNSPAALAAAAADAAEAAAAAAAEATQAAAVAAADPAAAETTAAEAPGHKHHHHHHHRHLLQTDVEFASQWQVSSTRPGSPQLLNKPKADPAGSATAVAPHMPITTLTHDLVTSLGAAHTGTRPAAARSGWS
jgi:hypothetical protein